MGSVVGGLANPITSLTSGLGGMSGIGSGVGGFVGDFTGGLAQASGANVPQTISPEQQAAFLQALQNQGNLQAGLQSQLQAQAAGQGPNPAQQALQQATNKNIAQNAGFIASQKGINPALAQREAAYNAAGMNQQAAGQGALMQAQQQLAAQQALQQSINAQNQTALAGLGMNQQANVANAQLRGQMTGSLLGAAGQGAAAMAGLAHGGKVDMKLGGHVPGKAKVAGDSYANDTVHAMLSPGEIVVPRSIATQDGAPQKAAEFVAKVLAKKRK